MSLSPTLDKLIAGYKNWDQYVRRDFLDSIALVFSEFLGTSGGWIVRAMTAAGLPTNTYDAPSQTKTASSNGAFNDTGMDGITSFALGDRIWDKNAATGKERGLFVFTDMGSASTPWKMKRAPDASKSSDFTAGKIVEVGPEGTANGGEVFHLTNATFVLDTDTPAVARETGVVHTDDAQTITALKSFATLMLGVWNSGKTFQSKFATWATANRTVTLPDVDATMAQAGVASAGTAPAFTGSAPAFTGAAPSAAMSNAITGFTGTTTGKVTTLTAGGATVAAHALAGATVTDGTVETTIVDNSALTATSGTITTATALSGTITATGSIFVMPVPAGTNATVTGTVASHTHVQT